MNAVRNMVKRKSFRISLSRTWLIDNWGVFLTIRHSMYKDKELNVYYNSFLYCIRPIVGYLKTFIELSVKYCLIPKFIYCFSLDLTFNNYNKHSNFQNKPLRKKIKCYLLPFPSIEHSKFLMQQECPPPRPPPQM